MNVDHARHLVADTDHRAPQRIVADALHAVAYFVRGTLDPTDAQARGLAAGLVRDGLALLSLAGGTAEDVVAAAHRLDLYRRADDDDQPVGRRPAAAGRPGADDDTEPLNVTDPEATAAIPFDDLVTAAGHRA